MSRCNRNVDGATIVVPNFYVFANTTARDNYFAANPNELIANMFIKVDATYQQRIGTSWIDVTIIVKGDKGDKGDTGDHGSNGASGAQGIQGIQGVQGATGVTGASGISWRGTYGSITPYASNDAVGYNGSTYYCIQGNYGGHLPTDTAYWQPLAMQGAQGIQGVQGIQGLQGGSGGDIGDIKMTALANATTGWLLCDGLAVSRVTYAGLFTAIGIVYGAGDGSTTFNVPNLKGRVPVGYDASQTEFNVVGKTGGAKTHQLITSEMPSHTHPFTDYAGGNQQMWRTGSEATVYPGTYNRTTGTTGGNGAHNNLQPYIALNYVIKY